MIAPIPTVTRKATISEGTARRRAGSAVSSRRYAGLAIDWASPLMESERTDACAASARAIPASPCPRQPRSDRCAASLRITFIGIETSRFVESPRATFSPCRNIAAQKTNDRRRGRAADGSSFVRRPHAAVRHPGDDILDVARERCEPGYSSQRRFGLAATRRLERPPALECRQQPGCDLRIPGIEIDHRLRHELVTRPVRPVELGLIAVRKRADQRADAVGIGEGECGMG